MAQERLVVVGVDGSDGGRKALSWAIAHAQQTGAMVHVVTVFGWDIPMLAYAAIGEAEHPWDDLVHRQEADVQACLAGVTDPPIVSQTVLEGDPVHALTHLAEEADLLVLGSHGVGHHGVRRALLGSVADGCVRRSAAPVVIIPAHEAATSEPRQHGTVQTR